MKEFLMMEERKDFETNQNISWFTYFNLCLFKRGLANLIKLRTVSNISAISEEEK